MAVATLGAPGVYLAPERSVPVLGGVRLDVCAFLGVAPRGSCRVPDTGPDTLPDGPTLRLPRRRSIAVPVDSFDEYRRLFGGFEGPGRLPFAVASFFEQGGRRAYVVRIVHEYGNAADNSGRVARGVLPGLRIAASGDPVFLAAASEGAWGNGLRTALGFVRTPLRFRSADVTSLLLDSAAQVPAGSLLRLEQPGGLSEDAFVAELRRREVDGRWVATLDHTLAEPPVAASVVTASLLVDDGAGLLERHDGLGLSPFHPRWLATVLCHESELVAPGLDWDGLDLEPTADARFGEPVLPPLEPPPFAGGEDRYQDLVPEDFFDGGWVLGDPSDEGGPGAGLHAVLGASEIATVVLPDLYSPFPLAPVEEALDPETFAGPEFGPCVPAPPRDEPTPPPPGLDGLALDPRIPADFEAIVALQARAVALAEATRAFVVLLDVPPGIEHRRVLDWRSRFSGTLGSSYAAAYHPWLQIARPDDGRDALILLPPSAAAAGQLAARELTFGVPHGPWNAVAREVVGVAERISPPRHDELHGLGVNVFLPERDGVVLYGGRTLAEDPSLRQLSVRRLLMLLVRALERETWWLVFEPNGPALWAEVRRFVGLYLRRLHQAGAFRGATEEEAFFVRCDGDLNPPRVQDAGQLVVEIGVAPAEPLEFIVLRLIRGGDGTLTVEA